MAKFPEIINRKNFPEVWVFVVRKNSRARQCAVIEKVSSILGNLLFLMLVLFFGCGLLLRLENPLITGFLKGFPWFYSLWLEFAIILAGLGLSQTGQIVLCVVLSYLVPLTVCAIPALLIRTCYHPELVVQPEGTDYEKAEALRKLGNQTVSLTRHSTAGAATISTIVFVVAVGVLATMFILQNFRGGELDANQILGTGNLTMILMIGAFGLLFGYAFINYMLLKLLKLLHICRLPKEMMYTLELYCEQCRPEEKAVKGKEKV